VSFDWNEARYRPKDLAIVTVIAVLGGIGMGQCASQQSYDDGYRRAVAETETEAYASTAYDAADDAAIADAAATDAAAAAGEAADAAALYGTPAYTTPLPTFSGENFHGLPCTDDCSGHEAGYAWAEENEITDPDTCDGNSNSFVEGCIAWAEEN